MDKPMHWIRLWTVEGIMSQDKWTIAEEGLFTRLLRHAGRSLEHGKINITPKMGYTEEQVAALCGVSLPEFNKIFEQLKIKEMVTIDKNNVITIVNWKKYQTEYDRQKGYRERLQTKVTGRKEVEVEVEVNKDTNTVNQEFNSFVEKYNTLASRCGLALCSKATEGRAVHFVARKKDGMNEKTNEIFEKIEKSDFLRGKTSDWKVNIDFLLDRKDGWIKILEGKYDNQGKQKVEWKEDDPGYVKSPRGR